MGRFIALVLVLVAVAFGSSSVGAQDVEVIADIGLPGATDRFLVATIRGRTIVGCVTSSSRICTRTRAVVLDARARAELGRLLTAIEAMPRCEAVTFAPGDPEFTLTIDDRAARGHLPRARARVPSRTDEPCEAEHALAWWIVQKFG